MKNPTDQLGQKIYLDANAYIYALEAYPEYIEIVMRVFDYVEDTDAVIIASQALLVELLPKPLKDGKQALAAQYERIL